MSIPQIRCRNAKCNNREEGENGFIKCLKCSAARYCSQQCLETDLPIHQLMCKKDRVLLDNDGNVTSLEDGLAKMALEVKAQNQTEEEKKSTRAEEIEQQLEDAVKNNDEKVYLGPERDDNYVMKETINRLQMQTNLFYIDQLETLMKELGKNVAKKPIVTKKKNTTNTAAAAAKKALANKKTPQVKKPQQPVTKPPITPTTQSTTPITQTEPTTTTTQTEPTTTSPVSEQPKEEKPQQQITIQKPNVFLFMQTENPVSEYRWLITDKSSPKLNRQLICYFMSESEFFTEVLPHHPHPGFKAKDFKTKFSKLLKETDPTEAVITLGLFGADKIYFGRSDLPPYDSMIAQLEEFNQFAGSDCLELNIDQ